MSRDELTAYEQMRAMGASDAAIAAYDILNDSGVPGDQCWELAFAAERSGRDPEAFARHFAKLRRAVTP